jgi:rRNA maturation endonuclease Nob1
MYKYHCTDCGGNFTSENPYEEFCPCCGSEMIFISKSDEEPDCIYD